MLWRPRVPSILQSERRPTNVSSPSELGRPTEVAWGARQMAEGRRDTLAAEEHTSPSVSLTRTTNPSIRARLPGGSPQGHVFNVILEGTWRCCAAFSGLPAPRDEAV